MTVAEQSATDFLELITENEKFEYEITSERKSRSPLRPGVLLRVEGASGITESANRNNRYYTNRLWERVLAKDALLEKIKNRGLFGEADHPNSFGTAVMRASHIVTRMWLEAQRNALMGAYEVLDVLPGRVVRTLFMAETMIGVSTRGAGNVKSSLNAGYQTVDENDYRFSTIDFVIDPSAQNAYPQPVQEQLDELFRTPRRDMPFDPGLQNRVDELVAMVESMRQRELLMLQDVDYYKGLAYKRMDENRTLSAPTPVPSREVLSLKTVILERKIAKAGEPAPAPEKLSLKPVIAERTTQELEETREELVEHLKATVAEAQELQSENEGLKARAADLEERLAEARRQLDDGHEAFVALRRQLDEAEAAREGAAEERAEVLAESQDDLHETTELLSEQAQMLEEKDTIISDLQRKLTTAQSKFASLQERERALKMMLVAKASGVPLRELQERCSTEGITDLREVESKARELALSRLRTDLPRFELSDIQELSEFHDQATQIEQQITESTKSLVSSVGGYGK